MAGSQPIALVVDDEPDICDLLTMTLQRMDVRTDIAMSVAEAKRRLADKQYDFCLTDMRLPDGDGLEVVAEIQQRPLDQSIPVAVITAHGNMDTAISALKLGAFDFVSKPINLKPLRALVQLALRLSAEKRPPQTEWHPLLQGPSAAIEKLQHQIDQLSRSDAPVHIRGEKGCGKELVAREIHRLSPRADAPFTRVHCSSEQPDAQEAALFGTASSAGLLSAAHGGTLFLSNIVELPDALQVKLLQSIEQKTFYSPLDKREQALDVRIISATQHDLASAAASDQFRSDLYYRIHVVELAVPSLRHRQDDIPTLARSVLRDIAASSAKPTPRLTQEALAILRGYPFPANLRQLENILQRAFTLCDGKTIKPEDLQLDRVSATLQQELTISCTDSPSDEVTIPVSEHYPGQFSSAGFESLDNFLQEIEKRALESALEETRWNRTAAAEKLGISFRSLRYRLKKLGLEDD